MRFKYFLLISILLTGCQTQTITETPSSSQTPSLPESSLSMYNATLEQANAEGKTLWKIKSVQTIYTPDRKNARLKGVSGNFWQDGEVVIYLTADEGEILKDGELILLKNNVVATDIRNGAVVRADKLEWYPKKNVLILLGNLAGQNPQFNITAQVAKYYTDRQELELIGNVVGYSNEPQVQFQANELSWNISQETLLVNSPLKIIRYDQNQVITDKIVAERLEVDLKQHQAKFKQNVELISLEPPVQIASNSVIWNYQKRTLIADQPVQLIHDGEQLTVKANRAEVDLAQEIAHLTNGVLGETPRNQAKLYASELVWTISTQVVEAKGNVIYEQVNPFIYLTGDKAIGKIQDNNLVVTSEENNQVVTEIVPPS